MTDVLHPAVANGMRLDANPSNTAISTYTGRTFDLFNPMTWAFSRMDIAHALSTINRFAGHVDFYSVGEHSLRVSKLVEEWGCSPDVQLLGLLHDASEAYLLDIPRPWKGTVYIGDRTYTDVEDDIQTALFHWAGIAYTFETEWDIVKEADMEMYKIEAASRPSPSAYHMTPHALRTEFLWRWEALSGARSEL